MVGAKSDKLQIATGAVSTRYVIHEILKKKRNGREYIEAKPYVRIVARLAAVPGNYADVIPPFNPYKLYGGSKPTATAEEEGTGGAGRPDVSIKVVELLGAFSRARTGRSSTRKKCPRSLSVRKARKRWRPEHAAKQRKVAKPPQPEAQEAAGEQSQSRCPPTPRFSPRPPSTPKSR